MTNFTVQYNNNEIVSFSEELPINISYNGSTIGSISNDGEKILKCKDLMANDNIGIGSKLLLCKNKMMLSDITILSTTLITSTTIVITGTGNTNTCYVTVNDTKYYRATTITAQPGDIITCGIRGYNSSYPGSVNVNGTNVLKITNNSSNTYDYTIPIVSQIQINLNAQSTTSGKSTYNYSTIDITEG